jgi:dynein light chain 1
MTTTAQALKAWEANEENGPLSEAVHIKLYCQMPPITKMDNSLAQLANCERLALSTNSIDKIMPLTGMSKIKILSLARNQIKKIEKLEDVAGTLEELWLSYNAISTLDGVSALTNLTTLYLSNNIIKSWSELEKLQSLENLKDVLFFGNPIYDDLTKEQCRIEVLKKLPNLTKIDGDMVKPAEREQAQDELNAGTARTNE